MNTLVPPVDTSAGARARELVSDSLALARRNLEHVRQIPEKLLDVTLQPLMFVLLFAFVFGNVIHVPGGSYREYTMAACWYRRSPSASWA
ncbi:MAG: hypothetical protein ABI317_14800, partial [Gaiellales bacterium]